jgi:hypothetical protein
MRLSSFILVAGLLLLPLQGGAETTGTEDARLKAAETLYVAGGYEQDMRYYVDSTIKAYAVTIARRGGKPSPDIQEKVAQIVAPDFQVLLDRKKQQIVTAFAQHLSTDDMNATIAWCNSPAGQHFRAAKSAMLDDIYASSRATLMAIYDQVWKTRQAEFVNIGLNFGGSAH